MSSSARYSGEAIAISILFDALCELKAAHEEMERLKQIAYEQDQERQQWQAELELIKNAPIRITKMPDQKICIEPVDETNPAAVDTVKKVKQAYSRISVLNELKKKGYDKVKEQKMPDGSIRLVVQKWQ